MDPPGLVELPGGSDRPRPSSSNAKKKNPLCLLWVSLFFRNFTVSQQVGTFWVSLLHGTQLNQQSGHHLTSKQQLVIKYMPTSTVKLLDRTKVQKKITFSLCSASQPRPGFDSAHIKSAHNEWKLTGRYQGWGRVSDKNRFPLQSAEEEAVPSSSQGGEQVGD